MDSFGIADTVRITGPDDEPRCVFEVDGEDFPWFADEHGPSVRRVDDDLYLVKVRIPAVAKIVHADGSCRAGEWIRLSIVGNSGRHVMIDDVEFPWLLHEDGVTIQAGRTIYPGVELTFFARDVDSTLDIDDQRGTSDVMDIHGDMLCVPL